MERWLACTVLAAFILGDPAGAAPLSSHRHRSLTRKVHDPAARGGHSAPPSIGLTTYALMLGGLP